MSASRSAANSPLRCSSHRSAASPSSPDDRQLARARLFLRRKRRTPTGPSSAPSPQQIALNDPLEASRAATAASLSSDRFRHRESISSCLPFSTLTQPALVLFPNQIRIYSQQAPSKTISANALRLRYQLAYVFRLLAKPFWCRGGPVEKRCGLERFELSGCGCCGGLRQERLQFGIAHWMERADRLERLIEDFHTVDAGDDDGSRQIQRVMKTLDGRHHFRFQQNPGSHALHPQHADASFYQLRQD